MSEPREELSSLIGQAIAGNGRLSGGGTLLEKHPERYRNALTDWVDLMIAEVRAEQSLTKQDATYRAALELVARIDEDLTRSTGHYYAKTGRLLWTLDQVILAILTNTLEVANGT